MSYCRMVALSCWFACLGCVHLVVVRDLSPWFWLVPLAYLILTGVALAFAEEIDGALSD